MFASDEYWIRHLFEAHYASLYRYLVAFMNDADAAEDAVQEAFVRLWQRPPVLGAERSWLYRVATNVLRDNRRSQRRRTALLRGKAFFRLPYADEPASPDTAVQVAEGRSQLAKALARLPEKQRMALLLRQEGFTHAEIATAVGTTTKSVGTLLVRALDRAARELKHDEPKEQTSLQ